jgi:glucose uptake protein GlcU
MLTYILLWVGLLFLAIINGALRDFTYLKTLGEQKAHQLSTIILLILISVYSYFVFGYWNLASEREAILVGVLWLILTLAFEFLFGHFVAKHSWEKLLRDYNIFKGRLWILILIWTTIVPLVYYLVFEI